MWEGRVNHEVVDPGDGTSIERPEIGGMSVLPVISTLVNHLGELTSVR